MSATDQFHDARESRAMNAATARQSVTSSVMLEPLRPAPIPRCSPWNCTYKAIPFQLQKKLSTRLEKDIFIFNFYAL